MDRIVVADEFKNELLLAAGTAGQIPVQGADGPEWTDVADVISAGSLIWRPLMALDPASNNYMVVTDGGGSAIMVQG